MIPQITVPASPLASGPGAGAGQSQAPFLDFLGMPAPGNSLPLEATPPVRSTTLNSTGAPATPPSGNLPPNWLATPALLPEDIAAQALAQAPASALSVPTPDVGRIDRDPAATMAVAPTPLPHPYTALVVEPADNWQVAVLPPLQMPPAPRPSYLGDGDALVALSQPSTTGDLAPATRDVESDGTLVPAVLIPWRLSAAHGLSYLGNGDAMAPLLHLSGTGAYSSAPVVSTSLPAAMAPGASPQTRIRDRLLSSAHASAAAQSGSTTDVARASNAGDPDLQAAQFASPLAWPLRLLRWLSDPQGGTTAWLRDFGLEEAELPALIEEIVTHARNEGIDLRRIVLNGQERWHANNPTFFA